MMSEIKPNHQDSVQEVVRSAHRELMELLRQRAGIMARIGTIKKTLSGLAQIFGESVLDDDLLELLDLAPSKRTPGLTRACREVLMSAPVPRTADEICEILERQYASVWQRQKNPIASVTTVLNRLVEYSEARSGWNEKRKRVWQWCATSEKGPSHLLKDDEDDLDSPSSFESPL
jgi:chorismate mutase